MSLSTAPGGQPGVISPEGIEKARDDQYMLSLNDSISESKQIVYIRLLSEMNGHWNPYSAFNADGSSRGSSHSTKNGAATAAEVHEPSRFGNDRSFGPCQVFPSMAGAVNSTQQRQAQDRGGTCVRGCSGGMRPGLG